MKNPQEELFRIHKKPKLNKPVLIAAWPGVANVALEAANYLKDKLNAEEFAEMEPSPFFDLTGVYVEKNLVQPPRFPESKFFFWKRDDPSGGDLIIFTGEAQPSSKNQEFADRIVDFVCGLGVKEIYTFAAALISHLPEKPRVWAATTDVENLHDLERNGLILKGDFFIAGMNGLLISLAKEKGLKGTCLLGETPRFLSEMRNPIASQAILEELTRLLKLIIDMSELDAMADQMREQVDEMVKETRRQFIKDFTVPLWERPEGEES